MLMREPGAGEMNEMGRGVHHSTPDISGDSRQPRRRRRARGTTLKMQKRQICLLR